MLLGSRIYIKDDKHSLIHSKKYILQHFSKILRSFARYLVWKYLYIVLLQLRRNRTRSLTFITLKMYFLHPDKPQNSNKITMLMIWWNVWRKHFRNVDRFLSTKHWWINDEVYVTPHIKTMHATQACQTWYKNVASMRCCCRVFIWLQHMYTMVGSYKKKLEHWESELCPNYLDQSPKKIILFRSVFYICKFIEHYFLSSRGNRYGKQEKYS